MVQPTKKGGERLNDLDTEKLTLLGRIVYPWAITYRNRLAIQQIPDAARSLLDFGGGYGYLIKNVGIEKAVSIDEKITITLYRDISGKMRRQEETEGFLFVERLPFESNLFDCITAVAAVEHIRNIKALFEEFYRVLSTEGTLIVTVPSRWVDHILPFLDRGSNQLRGKSVAEEHEHHLDKKQMREIVRDLFEMTKYRRFQLGLNQLFVFKKAGGC